MCVGGDSCFSLFALFTTLELRRVKHENFPHLGNCLLCCYEDMGYKYAPLAQNNANGLLYEGFPWIFMKVDLKDCIDHGVYPNP